MKRILMAGVVVLLFSVGVRIGLAHHSYAEFLDHTVVVEGTLEKAAFGNPHTILTLRTNDAALYSAIWNAAFQLQSRGVHATDLKVGDVLVVTGFPSRDPAMHQLAKLREVRRPTDGWTWRIDRTSGHVTVTGGLSR